MAYPGTKKSRSIELQIIKQTHWETKVDPFFGGGGLSRAFLDHHTAEQTIAGEVFQPLRSLYTAQIDFKELADRVLWDIDELGSGAFWASIQTALSEGNFRYTSAECFVILNNLSHGNGMRHGKNKEGLARHNTPLAPGKLEALRKRKVRALIDPIAYRPTGQIFPDWRSAVMAAKGQRSIALIDPPYIKADSIYPNESSTDCSVIPVSVAMLREYGAIVAYNSNCLELNGSFESIARIYGYSCQMTVTDWATRYRANSTKKEATEAMWVFLPEFDRP